MHKKAFSLIELLVVIAIIGIMTSIGMVSLTAGRISGKLDAAGREVASAIKLAQSYALQGKVVQFGGKNVIPCGYRFSINDDLKGYEVAAIRAINCDEYNSSDPLDFPQVLESDKVVEGALENSVVFSDTSSFNKNIYFSVPHGVIYDGDGKILSSVFELKLNLSGKTKNISVSTGGTINESVVQ